MNLSMDIIVSSLSRQLTAHGADYPNERKIERCVIYDGSPSSFGEHLLTVCSANKLPSPESVPPDSNVVICGNWRKCETESYNSVNFAFSDTLSVENTLNRISQIFYTYDKLSNKLEMALYTSQDANAIMDIGAKIVGLPISMLDLNYNAIALSASFAPRDDKLWAYLEEGYGSKHRDIVAKSEPKLPDVVAAENSTLEVINNISNRALYCRTLFWGTLPMAVIAMHAPSISPEKFTKAQYQLFNYVVDVISRKNDLFSHVKISRGDKREEILSDLLFDLHPMSDSQLAEAADILKIDDNKDIFLGAVFGLESASNDTVFMLIGLIEQMFSAATCVMLNQKIYVQFTLDKIQSDKEKASLAKLRKNLTKILESYNCKWVVSYPVKSLSMLSSARDQLDDIVSILEDEEDVPTESMYFELASQHAVELFKKTYPGMMLCHPILRILMRYDLENGTDLLFTFKAYLENNCNTTETAKKLFLHRNSMQYRLSRIDAIIDSEPINTDYHDAIVRKDILFSYACMDSWLDPSLKDLEAQA